MSVSSLYIPEHAHQQESFGNGISQTNFYSTPGAQPDTAHRSSSSIGFVSPSKHSRTGSNAMDEMQEAMATMNSFRFPAKRNNSVENTQNMTSPRIDFDYSQRESSTQTSSSTPLTPHTFDTSIDSRSSRDSKIHFPNSGLDSKYGQVLSLPISSHHPFKHIASNDSIRSNITTVECPIKCEAALLEPMNSSASSEPAILLQALQAARADPRVHSRVEHRVTLMERKASVTEVLTDFKTIKSEAESLKKSMNKAMDGPFINLLKMRALRKKTNWHEAFESLCSSIEKMDMVQLQDLEADVGRRRMLFSELGETAKAITLACYALNNMARKHAETAAKIQTLVLGFLLRLLIGWEKLVDGVRMFTGRVVTLNGKDYGKDIHLISQLKACKREWRELEDDDGRAC